MTPRCRCTSTRSGNPASPEYGVRCAPFMTCTVRGWNSHQFNQELVDKIRASAGDVDAVGADVRYLTRRSFLRRYGISAAD